jgi:hypothetical protein
MEKELLAVVFAIDKFRSYLVGAKVIVYMDHAALKYLLTKKDANHDPSVGFCSYNNSIWKSKIRKE